MGTRMTVVRLGDGSLWLHSDLKRRLVDLSRTRIAGTRDQATRGSAHRKSSGPLETHARDKLEHWRQDYNQVRPHCALGDSAPEEFASAWQTAAVDAPANGLREGLS